MRKRGGKKSTGRGEHYKSGQLTAQQKQRAKGVRTIIRQGTRYPEPLFTLRVCRENNRRNRKTLRASNFYARILHQEMPDLASKCVTDTNDKTAGLYEHVYLQGQKKRKAKISKVLFGEES